MSDIKEFLEMFSDKPADLNLLVWTLPDKVSAWFQDLNKADEYVKSVLDEEKDYNIYAGVGLVEQATIDNFKDKKFRRCKANDIKGIVGLWADIDVAGEGHSKKNLPPSKDKAQQLIKELPFYPSMIIDSGHGLQAWWQFKEPWIFDDIEENQEASDLAKRWIYTIKEQAKKHNWDVDATTDLSRVMRVAGTYNNKSSRKPVKIIDQTDNRFNPTEFEPYLVDIEELTLGFSTGEFNPEIGKLDLDPQAHPPFDKWEALKSIEPNVNDSWEHKRDDFQDQSASAYDMSLATYCAMAEWEDNEIVHLLIAHRRKHNEDLKLRQDYYQRTISKARKMASKNRAEENLELITDKAEKVNTKGNDVEKSEVKKALLKNISAMFGVRIKRFIKYTCDPPQYRIETDKGNIMLGGAGSVLRQSTFRANFLSATNVVIPKFKSKKWDKIIQALMNASVEESLGEEATNYGTARVWLSNYLRERAILNDKETAVEDELPFTDDDGTLYIFGNDFRKWLKINQEKINSKEMGSILRAYDCEPTKINVEIDGRPTTRGVWKLPDEIYN